LDRSAGAPAAVAPFSTYTVSTRCAAPDSGRSLSAREESDLGSSMLRAVVSAAARTSDLPPHAAAAIANEARMNLRMEHPPA
jgi:hypothetical protein